MRFTFLLILSAFIFSCKNPDPDQSRYMEKPSILVVNGGENSLSIIDPETFLERKRMFIQAPQNTFVHHIHANSDFSKLTMAFPEYDFSGGHDGLHNLQVKGHVVIIDRKTETVERSFSVPFANHNAIFSQDGKEIWTSLVSHSGRVMVYNSENGSLVKAITVHPDPHEVIASEDGRYVLVTGMESSFMSVIDAKTKEILREIKVDPFPTNVWHGKNANEVIVENSNYKSLNFVDLNRMQVTDHIDFEFTPGFSKFSSDEELWICAKGENFLYIYKKINGSWTQLQKIATENDPHHLLFLSGRVWLVNQKQNTVEIFDQKSKEKISGLHVGSKPNAILFIP